MSNETYGDEPTPEVPDVPEPAVAVGGTELQETPVPAAEEQVPEYDAAAFEAEREEHLTRLFTSTVVGPNDERIGKVGQVYLDDQTQEPNWITVRTGLFGMKEHFVPLDEAQLEGKHITVPYDKAQVLAAPTTEIDQNLSPSEEDALYNHYRVPGRMTEADLEAPLVDDTMSVVPGLDGDDEPDAEGGALASASETSPADDGDPEAFGTGSNDTAWAPSPEPGPGEGFTADGWSTDASSSERDEPTAAPSEPIWTPPSDGEGFAWASNGDTTAADAPHADSPVSTIGDDAHDETTALPSEPQSAWPPEESADAAASSDSWAPPSSDAPAESAAPPSPWDNLRYNAPASSADAPSKPASDPVAAEAASGASEPDTNEFGLDELFGTEEAPDADSTGDGFSAFRRPGE